MAARPGRIAASTWLSLAVLAAWPMLATAQEAAPPSGPLARKLAGVKFDHYAEAPGYSEGPTWRNGEVFFCSDGLRRVDREKKVTALKSLGPAGTFLTQRGSILVCDNKLKALVELTPDDQVDLLVEKFEGTPLNSLNDLTVDAKGNVYWTDPAGSSKDKPTGKIFRLTPAGVVSCVADSLAFPNGLEVDPASRKLYVIESQTQKILRYDLPAADQPLGEPDDFYTLGGSGGDGCAFDADGNLWVADFSRPETKRGRIVVLSPTAELLATLDLPSELVSNITFGGANRDEIFCTTGGPPGVFHAKVEIAGFPGHPVPLFKPVRRLEKTAFE